MNDFRRCITLRNALDHRIEARVLEGEAHLCDFPPSTRYYGVGNNAKLEIPPNTPWFPDPKGGVVLVPLPDFEIEADCPAQAFERFAEAAQRPAQIEVQKFMAQLQQAKRQQTRRLVLPDGTPAPS